MMSDADRRSLAYEKRWSGREACSWQFSGQRAFEKGVEVMHFTRICAVSAHFPALRRALEVPGLTILFKG